MTQHVEIYDEPRPGADYIVQIKIKNGPLLRAIRSRGYKSANAFALACGVSATQVGKFLMLKLAPLTKTGKWAPSVELMAHTLRLPPEFLFPEQHLTQALKRSTGEFELARDDVQFFLTQEVENPEQHLLRDEMVATLTSALQGVSPRIERVLRLRFGMGVDEEQTLDEVAKVFGVGRERIRQMEAKGLRQLKHPARIRKLTTGPDFVPHGKPPSKPRFYRDRLRFEHEFEGLGLSPAEHALLRKFGDGLYYEYDENKGTAASGLVKKQFAKIIMSDCEGFFVITQAGRDALELEKQF